MSIQQGLLTISPCSGKIIPSHWWKSHSTQLLKEISFITQKPLFQYNYYSTGKYCPKLASGISLQFSNILTGDNAYVNFNVETSRQRNTSSGKKGTPLPNKHFIAKERSSFCKFWLSIGLPFPCRLSQFHDCMGKLRPFIFTADCINEKLSPKILPLFSITATELLTLIGIYFPDTTLTAPLQLSDNHLTNPPDKGFVSKHASKGIQENSGAGNNKYGLSLQGCTDEGTPLEVSLNSNSEPIHRYKNYLEGTESRRVQDQTNEEWIAEWEKTSPS